MDRINTYCLFLQTSMLNITNPQHNEKNGFCACSGVWTEMDGNYIWWNPVYSTYEGCKDYKKSMHYFAGPNLKNKFKVALEVLRRQVDLVGPRRDLAVQGATSCWRASRSGRSGTYRKLLQSVQAQMGMTNEVASNIQIGIQRYLVR